MKQEPNVRAQVRKNTDHHCAICKDAGEGLMLCASCSTAQHASCMIEFGGCSGCGEADPHGESLASKKTTLSAPETTSASPGLSFAEFFVPPSSSRARSTRRQRSSRQVTSTGNLGDAIRDLVNKEVDSANALVQSALSNSLSGVSPSFADLPKNEAVQRPHIVPCQSCGPHAQDPGNLQMKGWTGCSCCSCFRYSSEKRERKAAAGPFFSDVIAATFLLLIFVITVTAMVIFG